jgi:hypothetical protein
VPVVAALAAALLFCAGALLAAQRASAARHGVDGGGAGRADAVLRKQDDCHDAEGSSVRAGEHSMLCLCFVVWYLVDGVFGRMELPFG